MGFQLDVQSQIIDFTFNNMLIKIKIWEGSGQERFRSLWVPAIKKADIIIFMRDCIYDDCFEYWMKFIKEYTYLYPDYVKLILCLNKTDLIDINKKNEIYKDLLNKSKEYNNCPIFCISMKNDDVLK